MSTPTVETTRTGRPKVPELNERALQADADTRIADAVKALGPRATKKDLLQAYTRLLAGADETIAQHEKQMYRLALSLHILEGARGVWRGIGVSRETFSRRHVGEALGDWPERPPAWTPAVAERGKARKVRYYRNAATELPQLAQEVYLARQLQHRLIPLRDDLIAELDETKALSRVEIAEAIGRHSSRVAHILRAAAIKRSIAASPQFQAALAAADVDPGSYATAIVRAGASAENMRRKVLDAGLSAGVADADTLNQLLTH